MGDATLAPDEKLCPFCAETIKRAAIKCRYCGSELEPEVPVAVPPPPAPAAPEPATTREPRAPRGSLLSSFRVTVALVVVCLVLAVVAGAVWWRGNDPDSGSGAITSTQARDSGLQQATSLTEKVLSYDWQSLDKDVKANEALMTPSFKAQYSKTMSGVRTKTLQNQVKLTASAVATSVVSATSTKVVALVFVNQVTTAKGTGNQRLDQNRVLVTLTGHDGQWRVSKMDAF